MTGTTSHDGVSFFNILLKGIRLTATAKLTITHHTDVMRNGSISSLSTAQ